MLYLGRAFVLLEAGQGRAVKSCRWGGTCVMTKLVLWCGGQNSRYGMKKSKVRVDKIS